ncbi:MAG: hypothetical protein ACREFM_13395 [Hypericibacter sp.]
MVRQFIERYLEPGESLGEVIFGLIMLLTFTLGASVLAGLDRITARHIIVAAISCNLAWGIIDAAMFAMGSLFHRAQLSRFHRLMQEAGDHATGIAAIRRVIDRRYGEYSAPEDVDHLAEGIYRTMKGRRRLRARIKRDDLMGALIVFGLVAGPSLPPALPFLFVDDPFVAIRLSNAILIGMLFLAGFRWAHHTDANPWWAGGLLALFSVALVAVAIALGG